VSDPADAGRALPELTPRENGFMCMLQEGGSGADAPFELLLGCTCKCAQEHRILALVPHVRRPSGER
jgi:hypothetical protein